jgi:nucleotide-binding universal stress UspA family protein
MYNKILVPLDGSKRAEAILPHVEQLALGYQAKVILLQVIEYQIVTSMEGAFATVTDQELDLTVKKGRNIPGRNQRRISGKENRNPSLRHSRPGS